ncbi:AGAP006075-PA-like protein [Anopheles sinensis]|uniref:AGAP006075-PA-like protein n=1 Tax=Anopheles sinensis TaxID=74873 RepID=A0A084WL95_ANOSI|nr:AGAP006075-PA-like protein [Anopheles sinensis]
MGIPYALKASVLVMLVVQPGWRSVAGQCIRSEDHQEASECCRQKPRIPKDIAHNCFKENNEKGNLGPEELMVCVLNCAYNAMGVMNEAGEVIAEKYISSLTGLEGSMVAVVTNAAKSCADISADIKRDIENVESSCNLYPTMYQICVTQLTTSNCPAEHWTKSPICDQVKAGAQPC